jgi:hypothetical protein
MRRYVPVVLPFFIISAAYLVNWLYTTLRGKARWLVSSGLTAIWFTGILLSTRGFVSQIDYRGVISQLDRFSADLPPHSILIFGDSNPVSVGDLLGTPLHFLYGHDVYTLRDAGDLDRARFAAAIRGWQLAGRTVYWIGMPGGPSWPLTSPTPGPPADYQIESTVLEHAYDHKPTTLSVETRQVPLAEVSQGQD